MNKQELTARLKACFKDFDPDMYINIFDLGNETIEFDAVSQRWENIRIFKRIEFAVELVMNNDEELSSKYAYAICPVTPHEFSQRIEDEKN